jgi:hypothetical protein
MARLQRPNPQAERIGRRPLRQSSRTCASAPRIAPKLPLRLTAGMNLTTITAMGRRITMSATRLDRGSICEQLTLRRSNRIATLHRLVGIDLIGDEELAKLLERRLLEGSGHLISDPFSPVTAFKVGVTAQAKKLLRGQEASTRALLTYRPFCGTFRSAFMETSVEDKRLTPASKEARDELPTIIDELLRLRDAPIREALMIRITYVLLALVSLSITASSSVSAATVLKQEPCRKDNFHCAGLLPTTQTTQNFRSFTFDAPEPGLAEVSFHGTAVCNHDGNTPQKVDFLSQIMVQEFDGDPAINGPGGMRHVAWLFPSGLLTEQSFNLASTRLLTVRRAGPRSVYFRVRGQGMGADTVCLFYNLAFTVVFTP